MKLFLEKAESDVRVRENPSKKQQNPSIHIKTEPAQHHIQPPQKAMSHSLTGPTDAPARLQQRRGRKSAFNTPRESAGDGLLQDPSYWEGFAQVGSASTSNAVTRRGRDNSPLSAAEPTDFSPP